MEHNISNYDWWVDENGNGKKDITDNNATDNDETMSSRGYGYRNCTDGVAYWEAVYSRVNIPNWGNANAWDTGAEAAHYAVDAGNTNDIEPGDIAQSDDGTWGHVGFVTSVTKNAEGVVASFTTAELNSDGKGNYTTPTYNQRLASGNFKRGSGDWDHFIDVNGANKGLNNEALTTSTQTQAEGAVPIPAMVQRPNGETDVAVVGPGNSLDFYFNPPGTNNWGRLTVPGGQAYSTPAMIQRSSGETDIVVQGPNHSLDYYFNAPGSPSWGRIAIAGADSAFSAPVVVQRPSGETDVAVQGPDHRLDFYYNAAGSPNWGRVTVPDAQAYSTPAMIQRSNGETDIAVRGPDNTMDFYYNAPGSPNWGVSHVAANGWAHSAPSMIQRPTGETDIAVQGPDNRLDFYINAPGSPYWGRIPAAPPGTTYTAPNAPAMLLRSSGEVDIAVQGPGDQADFYYNPPGTSNWGRAPIAVPGDVFRAPVMVQRPTTGETDVVTVGPGKRLDFFVNMPGSPYWGVMPLAGAGATP
jgi:surface antigen